MQTAIIERVFVLNYDMIQATPLEEWRIKLRVPDDYDDLLTYEIVVDWVLYRYTTDKIEGYLYKQYVIDEYDRDMFTVDVAVTESGAWE